MMILMSPTKMMRKKIFTHATFPYFHQETKKLMDFLKTLSIQDIMDVMKVSETIAKQNYERFQSLRISKFGSDALYAYEGLQYKQLSLSTYNDRQIDYANNHVYILSGLYGVLKANDPIQSYRLEMKCRLAINEKRSLYEFWKEKINRYLQEESKKQENCCIINLTSKEYDEVLNDTTKKQCIQISFKVYKQDILKVVATSAKMARGAMLSYLIEHEIMSLKQVQAFAQHGFSFDAQLSSKQEFVFVKRD
ncbi:MAG: peroxide stress protein YaaA [Breznakia sp.]